MNKNIVTLILFLLAFRPHGFSQDNITNELSYDVYVNYPPLSITKEKLEEAQTLVDLNKWYKPSWVRSYISIEVLTNHKGSIKTAEGKNDTLTQEQKDNLVLADPGSDISVKVQYLPENTLKHNDPKEFNFTFTINPENEAKYADGQEQLKLYLEEKAINKIPDTLLCKYQLAAVKFTIDEGGHVIDPHIFWTTEDEKTDQLLLETICNMPDWKPAEYANGIKVKQEFVLTVGDMESCVVNLLNIRRD